MDAATDSAGGWRETGGSALGRDEGGRRDGETEGGMERLSRTERGEGGIVMERGS